MRRRLQRVTASALLCVLAWSQAAYALDGDKAAYYGGTVSAFANATEPVEGHLSSTNDMLILMVDQKPFAGTTFSIPYKNIVDLEYGQKAGRRVGTAVATTVLLGPIGLVSLFSKKRKHYLTIGYKDDAGVDQAAVFELGKDIVRTTLVIVKTRSGKQITYQDEEARKSGGGA